MVDSHSFLEVSSSFQINSLVAEKTTFIILRGQESGHSGVLWLNMSLKATVISGLTHAHSREGCRISFSQAVGVRPWILPCVLLRGSALNMAAGFQQCEQVREKERVTEASVF